MYWNRVVVLKTTCILQTLGCILKLLTLTYVQWNTTEMIVFPIKFKHNAQQP